MEHIRTFNENNYFGGIEFGGVRRGNESVESVKKKLSILNKIKKLEERKSKNPKAKVHNILPIEMSIDDAIKYWKSKIK